MTKQRTQSAPERADVSCFSTATAEAAFYGLGTLDLPDTEGSTDNIVKRLRVFRIGKLRDSMGRERDWTTADLDKMVEHFGKLRALGVLPNVPIRIDHTERMKDVVGWFHAVYRDPAEPSFLFADVEFTEPDAKAKYDRKTLRNRSIEVGRYKTNDGTVYEPVVLGLAFVDLPAVEGLFGANRGTNPGEGASGAGAPAPPDPANNKGEPVMAKFRIKGVETEDPAAVQSHIDTLEKVTPAGPPAKFRVNGTEIEDPAAAQTHIDALETFRKESIESGRTGFVAQLAKDNKIGNPQVEAFSALVKTMTDDQFDAFKKGWEGAPANNLFGKHAGTGEGGEPDPKGADATKQAISDLEEIVANHRRAGKSDADISQMSSFKQLQTLKAAAAAK